VTNYEKELHALYRNESTKEDVLFTFHTPASGIAAIGQRYVGWGTGFLDWDHHGWEDIFIANGHAIRYPTGADRFQKPVLLRNTGGGRFKDVTPRGGDYFRKPHLARGAALGDLDNDGGVDVVVSHLNEPVVVLRNLAPTDGHHWLGVRLAGKGHADIVGARAVLEADGRKQTRFAKGGGSYASAPDRRLVFGLGPADKVERLTVTWPDGGEQTWTDLKVDQYHDLVEGKKDPQGPKQP
jgi:enediyne biosynthesis protein E4